MIMVFVSQVGGIGRSPSPIKESGWKVPSTEMTVVLGKNSSDIVM